MERLPCGPFAPHTVFFRIGVLADNRVVLLKLLALPQALAAGPRAYGALASVSDGGQSGPACGGGNPESAAVVVGPV